MIADQPNPDEAAIEEFHHAARRRNVRVFAIASAICLLIGVAIVIVTFAADAATDEHTHATRRFEIRTLIYAAGFLVAGFGLGANAWRVHKGVE